MFRLFFLLLAVGLFGIAAEQREMDVTSRMGLQVGQQRRQVRSRLVERFVQTGIADELPDSPLPALTRAKIALRFIRVESSAPARFSRCIWSVKLLKFRIILSIRGEFSPSISEKRVKFATALSRFARCDSNIPFTLPVIEFRCDIVPSIFAAFCSIIRFRLSIVRLKSPRPATSSA